MSGVGIFCIGEPGARVGINVFDDGLVLAVGGDDVLVVVALPDG